MSHREKRLLILLSSVGFLVFNYLLYGYWESQSLAAKRRLRDSESTYQNAVATNEVRDQLADEIQWLTEHEPQPAAEQDIQTRLQEICEREATKAGLTTQSQKFHPSDATEGRHFQRAKFEITVNGTEQAFYQWLDVLNQPNDLRAATKLVLVPDEKDDTKIKCTVTIEQWFVPIQPTA